MTATGVVLTVYSRGLVIAGADFTIYFKDLVMAAGVAAIAYLRDFGTQPVLPWQYI